MAWAIRSFMFSQALIDVNGLMYLTKIGMLWQIPYCLFSYTAFEGD